MEAVLAYLFRVRGKRVLFLFDEVDRSPPDVVQAALTFTRRALALPSVGVLVCYVPAQIRLKAFHP